MINFGAAWPENLLFNILYYFICPYLSIYYLFFDSFFMKQLKSTNIFDNYINLLFSLH